MRRWRGVVGLVAVVGLLTACDVGSIRRPAPSRTPSRAASASPRSAIVEVRRVHVPVPADFTLHTLAFVDSTRGYAFFIRCGMSDPGRSCEASLLATVDGGRTWAVRRHPRPIAVDEQMLVNDDNAVMLRADPYGWYLSRDGGLTFRRTGPPETPPDDYYTLSGQFQLWNPGEGPSRVVEYLDRHQQKLPSQPPLAEGPADVKYDESGRLWVAGLENGKVVVALSGDRGRTWQRQEVPGPNGGLASARLEVAPATADVWLLASSGPPAFPRLWLFDGTGWREEPAIGAPPRMGSVAALGNSVLAVSEPAGGAGLVVPPHYQKSTWPLAGANLKVLSDGTLLASRNPPGDVFLGLGHGVDRQWVQVSLVRG